MIMIAIGAVVGWTLCGVLGYGMCYHSFQEKFNTPKSLRIMGETWCRRAAGPLPFVILIMGPFGLLVSIAGCGRAWGLQYWYKRPK